VKKLQGGKITLNHKILYNSMEANTTAERRVVSRTTTRKENRESRAQLMYKERLQHSTYLDLLRLIT
jgi:hypothetical protein